jgi:DNA recombination protein RmuC
MTPWLIIITILILGCAGLVYLLYKQIQVLTSKNQQVDEEKAKALVNQIYGEIAGKVIEQTKTVLAADKEAIFKDNQNKQQFIEKAVSDLKKEIEDRQREIRVLEQDRNKKFGEITTAISEHRKITEELKTSTESLAKVLSNNQTRGQWGERIIEDILTSAGLIENIHYSKQLELKSGVKPDITLLLPNERTVSIDVKFPYSEIQKMALAEGKEAKDGHLKAFVRDLKEKMNQIEKRGYISIEEGTLDYAIMFVPNEMLFSFINQQFPDIVDEAMAKKIMIVSPFTFLIVARTVMESYRNFMMENNLRRIVKQIQEFGEEWLRFKKDFESFDVMIDKLKEQYDKITTTRYKMMNSKLKKIEDYQQGALKKEERPLLISE